MGDKEVHARFGWGQLSGRKHMEDLGIDGRVILKWLLKWDLKAGLD
jgi:hypothetical protein